MPTSSRVPSAISAGVRRSIGGFVKAETEADIGLLCAGEMIKQWERIPEQEAEIQRENDLVIQILTAIDGSE